MFGEARIIFRVHNQSQLNDKHFPILKGAEYVVCEKTDGERYMMVATTFEGKPRCVFVNRSFDMIEVKINSIKRLTREPFLMGSCMKIHSWCMMLFWLMEYSWHIKIWMRDYGS